MGFQHVSQDLKQRALVLRDRGYNGHQIHDILGVSPRSIQRWLHNFKIHSSVVVPHSVDQGRPRKFNAAISHDVHTLLIESPDLYLEEILDWLAAARGVWISQTCLHENLQNAGISFKKLRKAAIKRDEEFRTQWRNIVQAQHSAKMIVAVDETSKDDRTLFRTYGRSPQNTRAVIDAPFVRGQRWSIVAALTTEGYLNYRTVKGSVDAFEFFDFIVQDIVSIYNYDLETISNHLFFSCQR